MAIPNELREFQSEADFRDQFIIPLLYRLGFSVVVNYHGRREFGRDVIFGEIDRFGHVVYYALQAKYVASISQSDSHGLIADAKESFGHDFHHPHKHTNERVCRFYVVNGGSIAPNARDNFFELLEKPLAANSVLLDGLSLLSFDRLATFNRGSMAKELLSGLLVEIRRNRSINLAQKLRDFAATGPYPMVRFRLAATVAMLERPVLFDNEFLANLDQYWHLASTINKIADSTDIIINAPDFQRNRTMSAIDLISKIIKPAEILETRLNQTIAELGNSVV